MFAVGEEIKFLDQGEEVLATIEEVVETPKDFLLLIKINDTSDRFRVIFSKDELEEPIIH